MSFSVQDVAKVAKLARLRVTDSEKESLAKELGGIFTWIEQLNEVDTGEAQTVASVLEQALPWRPDKVTDGGYPQDVTKNAPKKEYDCFVVPKVIAQD